MTLDLEKQLGIVNLGRELAWLRTAITEDGLRNETPITHDCGYNEDCGDSCRIKTIVISWSG